MLTTGSTLYSISRPYSSCITGNLSLLNNFPFPYPPSPWQSPFSLFLCFVYCVCVCVCVCVCACVCMCACMHAYTCSIMFYPLQPHELQPARLLSVEFSRQEYWSGSPFPLLGDLPDPGIEPISLAFPALSAGFLPLSHLHDFDYFRHLT